MSFREGEPTVQEHLPPTFPEACLPTPSRKFGPTATTLAVVGARYNAET